MLFLTCKLHFKFQQLGRSLFCLGLLVRYGDDLILSSRNKNSYVAKSLHLVKNYLLAEDFGLKARSLQVMISKYSTLFLSYLISCQYRHWGIF